MTAHLEDSPLVQQVMSVLPCRSIAQTWGEEVYFELPVRKAALEPDAQQVVDPGTVCYWVEGRSLALPYGPTPIARNGECRLVTRCNVLGRIEGDPRALQRVKAGDSIRVECLPGAPDA